MITRKSFADVLLVNGPGTCVMLCAAAYISRVSLYYCFIYKGTSVERLYLDIIYSKPTIDICRIVCTCKLVIDVRQTAAPICRQVSHHQYIYNL